MVTEAMDVLDVLDLLDVLDAKSSATHVMTLLFPHSAVPSIAASWAFQTASARFVSIFQNTTHPSASPVSRRVFWRTKWTL